MATWAKFTGALQIAGALIAVPVGAAGIYSTYQTSFSTQTVCQNLRGSILSVLERQLDVRAKHVLVQKDMAEFERSCARVDPDAKEVFAALDRVVLFRPDAEGVASAGGSEQAPAALSPSAPALARPFLGRGWFHQHPLARRFWPLGDVRMASWST